MSSPQPNNRSNSKNVNFSDQNVQILTKDALKPSGTAGNLKRKSNPRYFEMDDKRLDGLPNVGVPISVQNKRLDVRPQVKNGKIMEGVVSDEMLVDGGLQENDQNLAVIGQSRSGNGVATSGVSSEDVLSMNPLYNYDVTEIGVERRKVDGSVIGVQVGNGLGAQESFLKDVDQKHLSFEEKVENNSGRLGKQWAEVVTPKDGSGTCGDHPGVAVVRSSDILYKDVRCWQEFGSRILTEARRVFQERPVQPVWEMVYCSAMTWGNLQQKKVEIVQPVSSKDPKEKAELGAGVDSSGNMQGMENELVARQEKSSMEILNDRVKEYICSGSNFPVGDQCNMENLIAEKEERQIDLQFQEYSICNLNRGEDYHSDLDDMDQFMMQGIIHEKGREEEDGAVDFTGLLGSLEN
ncbi:hypothetical protein AgCh_025779 [Apium graveolens]